MGVNEETGVPAVLRDENIESGVHQSTVMKNVPEYGPTISDVFFLLYPEEFYHSLLSDEPLCPQASHPI
jgi:hypothetical protein